MDEFIKALFGLFSQRVSGAIGAVFLIVIVIPHLIRLWDTWVERRSGWHTTQFERARLEMLKLRYEIEAIRKQHDLPMITDTVVSPRSDASERRPVINDVKDTIESTLLDQSLPAPRRIWRWLAACRKVHPLLATVLINLIFGSSAMTCGFFLLMAVTGFFIEEKNTEIHHVSFPIGLFLTMIVIAGGFAILARLSLHQKRLLRKVSQKNIRR